MPLRFRPIHLSLVQPLAQGDQMPAAQPAPPPFGTVYQFEANGAITPTPEGIITPEGVFLRAGKPSRVPTERTAAVIAAAAATRPVAAMRCQAMAAPSPQLRPLQTRLWLEKSPKPGPPGLNAARDADQGALTPEVDSRLAGLASRGPTDKYPCRRDVKRSRRRLRRR